MQQPSDGFSTNTDFYYLIKNLGYQSSTNIQEGIDRFVKWLKVITNYSNHFKTV